MIRRSERDIGELKNLLMDCILCFMLIVLMSPILWSGEIKRCHVCGMDVSKYPHTKYVVNNDGG